MGLISYMKKSSLLPLAFIVGMFLVTPVVFWLFTSKSASENIKGAKNTGELTGVLVKIVSSRGTWDLNEYLCKDKEECLSTLFSGKSLDTTSGGVVDGKYISIKYSQEWDSYGFLKIFVKPGWGSVVRKFNAFLTSNTEGVLKDNLVYGGSDYDVVLIPVNLVKTSLIEAASFSD